MGEPPPNRIAGNLSVVAVSRARQPLDWGDAYLHLLCTVLAGYALFGKGFAYVGYPPLLIGEVTMIFGLVVIYRSGCGLAIFASLPSIILAALLLFVVAKVFIAIGFYGLDAVRDGVIVIYGLYAFAVTALLLEKPERFEWIIQTYSGFAWFYGLLGGTVYYITSLGQLALPVWPLSGIPIVYVRLGEAAVHLSAAAVFVLLGLRKVHPLWAVVMIIGIILISPSRGGMLACVVPIVIAAILGGQIKRLGRILLFGGALFAFAYAAGVDIPVVSPAGIDGGRKIGVEQIIDNIESIMGSGDAGNLEGTKEWRLYWWRTIVDYTFNGPYFWTGKGFGMSLAETDGFAGAEELKEGRAVTRSPHNAHLTMLARAGVPGLALWIAALCAWFGMVVRNIVLARKRGDTRWANIFIWIGCYVTSILIDASFDVALEGPMLGIWFWALFGLGMGASMIYRYDVLISRRGEWRACKVDLVDAV